MVAGLASDIKAGVEIAAEQLSSGAARKKLNELIAASNS
jgi:anthranilate phosphoribosyltransferase